MINRVGVGSSNPVKIRAVQRALLDRFPQVVVEGREVSSLVSSQPMSDEETSRGAWERATAVQRVLQADLGIGLEGGVFIEGGKVWNTVWCCVVDSNQSLQMVNGARFVLPERISKELLKGNEMGPVMDRLTGKKDVKKTMGMLGIVTDGMIDREEAYAQLVKLAVGRLLSAWK